MKNRLSTKLLITLVAIMMAAPFSQAMAHERGHHQHAKSLFVSVTADDNMTQGMALVLANQAIDRDADVRVLLCGLGGRLAVEGETGDSLAPRDVTPQQLLKRLIGEGAKVEICAIFLPNTEYEQDQLIDGVGVAQPGDVAEHMLKRGVHFFTF